MAGIAGLLVDPNYGFVILAASSSLVLNVVHTMNTGKYRKEAEVAYPACYAPSSRTDIEAVRFNSAQRAHANFTEHLTPFITALLVSGLKFPVASASMGAVWSVSRFFYMRGYSQALKAEGKGRYAGGLGIGHTLVELILIGTTAYTGLGLALGW
ncbi:hypothetical protein BJ878DRAFT_259975 [Calycina marina]|uniref:Glutathione S-transferase n=1 Tax=Calycina marina TaxID=1763456 RepID=A0A9P8CBH9_9HELO|nr:hypothetical protein BJ878DRAFT_259975 [Calycina marina]